MKKNYALTKLIIAVMAAATLCACEKPAAPVDAPVEVVEETVVEDPAPVVEETEEVVSETTEPEEVEETVEEIPMPEFILKDENGDYYVSQDVTAEDIYNRIDEVEDKHDFKNDWDRDSFVARLLARNASYMTDEDIVDVYEDYLMNYGASIFMNTCSELLYSSLENDSYVSLRDYYIDPVLAEEAQKFETAYLFSKTKERNIMAEDCNKLLASIDYDVKAMDNPVLEDELFIVNTLSGDILDRDLYKNFKSNYKNNKETNISIANNLLGPDYEVPDYFIDNYVSSHEEITKNK